MFQVQYVWVDCRDLCYQSIIVCLFSANYMPIIFLLYSYFTMVQKDLSSLKWSLILIHNSLPIFYQLYANYIPILHWSKRIWAASSNLYYKSIIVCLFSANYMPIIFLLYSYFTMVQKDLSSLQWALIPIHNSLPIFCQLYANYIPVIFLFYNGPKGSE